MTSAAGRPLNYYGSYTNVPGFLPDMFTTAGLIAHADGRCAASAHFYIDVLRAQGVTTAQYVRIAQLPGLVYKSAGLQVKSGLAGQNHAASIPTRFNGHAVVLVGGTLYDPSYGSYYNGLGAAYPALLAWDDTSVAGTWYIDLSAINNCIPTRLAR